MKITTFTDLVAWKESHSLVLTIYKLTSTFPQVERFVLSSQMRRCVISITSNIAEGFSRRTKKGKSQLYYMALGSTTELQNQLIITRDLHYIDEAQFNSITSKLTYVHKLINGLIKSSRNYP